jgi:hypothetical protein
LRRLELIDRLPKRDKDALLRMLINAARVRDTATPVDAT